MTKQVDVSNLRKLYAESTPGEWEEDAKPPAGRVEILSDHHDGWIKSIVPLRRRENIAFVIAAHNQMPGLLDELEHMRGGIERMWEACQFAMEWISRFAVHS